MNKILISLLLFLFSSAATASQTVPVVWPFSIGSNQANMFRLVIAEANKQQNKYNFILENKTGAGGFVAANYVQNYNGLAVLAGSASFYTRPVYYPKESHRVQDFKPVFFLCTDQPLLLISSKYKTIEELSKKERITVGANFGSLTETAVRELQKILPSTQVDLVPFAGTLPGTMEVIAGRIDLNVEFPADAQQYISTGKIVVIGTTGRTSYPNMPTFAGQGYRNFSDLSMNYGLYISNNNASLTEELYKIFTSAAKSIDENLNGMFSKDFCLKSNFNMKEVNNFYEYNVKYWKLN